MKKRVLVYPCGTEIGLEIYRSVNKSTHFHLVGGSSNYNHGQFVFEEQINHLPFITENSSLDDIILFNRELEGKGIDYIYPAMDGVLTVFSKYRENLSPVIISPDIKTALITRSKKLTYDMFKEFLDTPHVYDIKKDMIPFPVFLKPDKGQGAKGARKIDNDKELQFWSRQIDMTKQILLEYLPGKEYTIDCFTNHQGKLIYAKGRSRKRIKDGISVNAVFENRIEFVEIAQIINSRLHQRGGWFFQLKEDKKGVLKLLEIASRIAGTSSIARNIGVNLPLMTLFLFDGFELNSVLLNPYNIELDRALYNQFKVSLHYTCVYLDYDDTVIVDGILNIQLISFLYQCINQNIKLILLTKHKGNLKEELAKWRIESLFDTVIQLEANDKKYLYIKEESSIFIDDSFNERYQVAKKKGIPVFDTHMVECLLKN